MTRVQPKAMPNWCPQVNPDEPWTGRCVTHAIQGNVSPRLSVEVLLGRLAGQAA